MKPVLHILALATLAGCSFSKIELGDPYCPVPSIIYAGAEQSVLCNGSETTVRVDVLDAEPGWDYSLAVDHGKLVRVSGKTNEWRFTNEHFDGSTKFHAVVENGCGIRSAYFVVWNVACEEPEVEDTDSSPGVADTDSSSEVADTDSSTEPPAPVYDGPRHVILFIGDGMGFNSEIGASRYLTGADNKLSFHSFPYSNRVTTWDIATYNLFSYNADGSLYSPETAIPKYGYDPSLGGAAQSRGNKAIDDYFLTVQLNWPDPDNLAAAKLPATDSGSSATAMATGQKTDYRNISWQSGDPENGEIKTVAEYAREDGDMAMGVVSTVPFSHATPAAFVAHNVNRKNLTEITSSILHDTMPDVCISGGNPVFYENYKYVSEEEWEYLQNTDDWEVVAREVGVDGGEAIMAGAEAAIASNKPLIGIFGKESFEHPVPQDTPGNPSFVSSTNENPSLAEATQAALGVLSTKEAGFFLMVEGGAIDLANHKNDYGRMIGNMWDFERAVQAAVEWVNQDGDAVTMENTLIIVTADHANGYIEFDKNKPLGAGDLPTMSMDSGWRAYPDGEVRYRLKGHSNELVNIYAQGGGILGGAAELFAPYEGKQYPGLPIIDNTHIFYVMMDFLGLSAEAP